MIRRLPDLPALWRLCLAAGLVVLMSFAGLAVQAQTKGITVTKSGKSISVTPTDQLAPDYAAWERLADRAEDTIADRAMPNTTLDQLRIQLVDWRAALLVAQNTNSTRIATIRTQIDSLGPLPADGTVEAAEISTRRKKLTDQLVRLQAPGIAADEAYSRADGLIREIDRVLRERQADELLRLWPAPINPANWPTALGGISAAAYALWTETRFEWNRTSARSELVDNLPLIAVLLAFALGLIWRGRRWIEQLTQRLTENASVRGRRIWGWLASLGQIIIPTAGVYALSAALTATGLLGPQGTIVVSSLLTAGITLFAAIWLGHRLFPFGDSAETPLILTPERRAEGRFLCAMFGLLLAVETIRQHVFDPTVVPEATTSLLSFPLLLVSGILLARMGQMLRQHGLADTTADELPSFRNRAISLMGRAAVVLGYVGPLLAAVGYASAAAALVYPAIMSLALLGLLFILQQLVWDIFALLTRSEDAQKALLPVLVGFAMTLATLPLFALIWGARFADLTELWQRFREGFQIGNTRISPTDFLYFAVVFAIGYTLTRLFQGALKSTILPKTSLDTGGQNAIVSGVGYTGIFLAALIAINAAGIDLSGLAIVAGALSVGIGFGLQNIVSNFVSGIILLIERPVSEGDWIEVGTVSGTVKAISVRSTRIQTFDRSDVIVPNADLVAQRVTNWTRYNLTGRLTVPVTVVYGSDTRHVEKILRDIAEQQPMAILNPPPVVALVSFGADTINFEVRIILRDVNFSMAVRSEINHQIVDRFTREGIALSEKHIPDGATPGDHDTPPMPARELGGEDGRGTAERTLHPQAIPHKDAL